MSLGIDGGPIFQILAVENLGLSAAAIGLAFGFGVVSLPIQLYASRFPIERAWRNVQISLVLAALQAWVLAVLVGIGATGVGRRLWVSPSLRRSRCPSSTPPPGSRSSPAASTARPPTTQFDLAGSRSRPGRPPWCSSPPSTAPVAASSWRSSAPSPSPLRSG